MPQPPQPLHRHPQGRGLGSSRLFVQDLEERGHGVPIPELGQAAQGAEPGQGVLRLRRQPPQTAPVAVQDELVEVVSGQRELQPTFERSLDAVEESCHGQG